MKRIAKQINRFSLAAICGGALLGFSPSILAADGKALFNEHCVLCHGKDGRGKTPFGRKLDVMDLAKKGKLTDAEIKEVILEGIRDDKNVETMTAFKDKLSEEEIKALITVVRSFVKE